MNNTDFDSLFCPVGIAVYGASNDPNKLGGRPVRNLLEQGYSKGIYPINPKYDTIQGLKCYKSVSEIGRRVDAAVILLKAEYIFDAVKDCAAAGVKLGLILSSGFGELGAEGKALQQEIAAYATEHGMRLIGPNCLGVVNFKEGIPLTFSATMLDKAGAPGNIAICSQSGAFGSHIYGLAKTMGINFSYWFTTGNEADLQLNDCLKFVADKDEVKSVVAYMEDARDGAKLMDALDECQKNDKPVVLLKVGRSAKGSAAASSHTGALAGNAAVYNAVFEQKNVIQAENVYELLDFAAFAAIDKPLGQARAAIVTVSGGVGVLHMDKCEDCGVNVAELSPETKEKIAASIPAFGSAANPVDVTAQTITRERGLVAPLSYCMEDENVDVVMMYLAMYTKIGDTIADQFIEVAEKYDKPLIVTWLAGPEEAKQKMRRHGISVFDEPSRAVRAVGAVHRYWQRQKDFHAREKTGTAAFTPDPAALAELRAWLAERRELGKGLSEYESRKVLKTFNFPMVEGDLAASPEEAAKIAESIGFPVVMKIDSPHILHKSDVGGVVLNIKSAEEAKAAYETIMSNVSAHFDTLPPINGMLVEKMEKAQAEILIGCNQDPMFGPVIAFGMGGIFVELLKEIALRAAPLTMADAKEMVASLKGSKVLDGLRGKPKCDKEAVYDVILCISQVASELKDLIAEIDINPLFAYENGAKAADALVVLK